MGPAESHPSLYGIFGHPIHHSLSPQMQNAAFQALNLPHRYFPFDIPPDQLESAVESLRLFKIAGINVTIPHKENIIPFLDEIDPDALERGAVNTVKNIDGKLWGYNTDGLGFLTSLRASGLSPEEHPVLLLGAGGAAKGVLLSLLKAGVKEVILIVRRPAVAQALVKKLNQSMPLAQLKVLPWQDLTQALGQTIELDRNWLLINTTPLGMQTQDALPFPSQQIQKHWTVADLIYRPHETPLLSEAKKRGATTVPGLGMLIHQGAASFNIWTGLTAPLEAMNRAAHAAFQTQV